MKNEITINKEQELYVIPAGNGYTCLGFDVLEKRYTALANELTNRMELTSKVGIPELRGTKERYSQYQKLLDIARTLNAETGWRSSSQLSKQLTGLEGERVEVITNYDEKRRFYVGKSTGFIPCHLEIARINSSGGPAAETEYKSVRIVQAARSRY